MKVIGVVGLNGSGKDELINYLHDHCGVPKLSMGDVVRDIAAKEGIPPTRDKLHDISRRYFAEYGKDYFAKRLIKKIEEKQWQVEDAERGSKAYRVVGITGIRTPTDVKTLKEHFGQDFLLVQIEVSDPAIRYERMKQRGEARDPQTYEEFRQQDKHEEEMFHISKAIQQADLTINNDGTLQAFYEQIKDAVVQSELSGHMTCD